MSDKRNPASLVLEWAGPDKPLLVLSVIMAFVSGLTTMIPYLGVYNIMVALYEDACTWQVLADNALLVAIGSVVKGASFSAAGLLSHRGAYNTLFRVRCRVVDHLAHAPLGQLDERSTGSIKTVLSEDIEKLEYFLAHNMTEAVLYLTGPVAAFVFLCSVNLPLALATLVPFAAAIVIMGIIFRNMSSMMERASNALASLNAVMVEYVGGMRVIKALNMGAHSFRRFRAAVEEEYSVWSHVARKTGPGYAAFVVIIECGMLVMVPLGGWMFATGAIPGSTFLLFAFVGSLYLTEIRLLQEIGSQFAQVVSGAAKAEDLLCVPVFSGGVPFPAKSGVSLDHVSFSYNGETEVIRDVSLDIPAGEKLAIVGPSGAGKTTIVELISRFYDATKGTVSIGGVDVRDIDYDDLLAHVAVVFQKTFLTSGSIFENIAMGRTATIEEVREAARRARIDDFIMSLPDGYDTAMGTLGERLSGGQRQRIAIARAILKDAPLLILDEATSAADPENQTLIDEAIAELCKGRTVIIVAHRLGVVRTCDRVAYMEGGRLVDVGKNDDVLARCPGYRRAWDDYEKARNTTYSVGSENAQNQSSSAAATMSVGDRDCHTTQDLRTSSRRGSKDHAELSTNPFAKNRDFYLGVSCTVLEGLLSGCNFGIIYLVMSQVFSGAFDFESICLMTAALAAVLVLRLVIYGWGYVRGQLGGALVSRNLRIYLGDKIKRIPLSRFTERTSGDYLNALSSNVNDYEQILTHRTGNIIKDVTLAIMLTAFVFWLFPPAGVVMAAAFLLLLPAMAISWHQVKKFGTRKSAICASNTSCIVEHVTGMQTLRAYGIGGINNETIVESMRQYSDISFWYEAAINPLGAICTAVVGLAQPLLFLMCGSAWATGALDTVPFVMIAMLPLFLNKVWAAIFVSLTAYKNLSIARKRIQAVVDEPVEKGSFEPFRPSVYDIKLRDIDFAYLAEEPVLKGLSLDCAAGALTALVGDSGCGKSTVLNLIAQLYEPDNGEVVIGDESCGGHAPERILENMSIVDQNVFLFDDTVLDNVRYARPEASNEDVVRACKLANADEFIRKLPQGYLTVIGENGGRLSGGERQRLSIARAILRDAPIVLLDEATASLDIENELAVKGAVENLLAESKTVVMVAHTLPIVRQADSIAVIGDGRVIEQGSHDDLIALGGKYARMWEADRQLV